MNQTVSGSLSRGNQTMEVFRLAASILVIFAHVHFPGIFGSVVNCFARCSVPGFLALSGFFAYGASSRKLGRRLGSLARLTAVAFGLELAWGCLLVELEGGSSIGYLRAMLPNARELASFVLLNINPLRDTFWYLPAALEAMAALWLYVRFQEDGPVNYRTFYAVGFCLFACNLAMGTLGTGAGSPASIFQYRNGLFFGIPLLAMGVFLGEHWQRIVERFALSNAKLVLLTAACLGLSLCEWFGFGLCDVMVGSVSAVLFGMLLMAKNPVISQRSGARKVFGTLGSVATAIYVLHSLVIDGYERFWLPHLAADPREAWLRPLVVLGVTGLCAVLWAWGSKAVSNIFRRSL